MAYNEQEEESLDNELFGLEASQDDDNLLGNETFAVSPTTSTKNIVPATESDKEDAKKALEEKAKEDAAAKTKESEEEKLRKELEDEWNKDDPKAPKKPNDPNSPSSEEISELETIAEGLYKLGIFNKKSEDEEPPKTNEAFVEKFQSEIEDGIDSGIENFAGRHGDDWKEAFDAMFVDGMHPLEYIARFSEIKSLKDMDLTDESNQERVVTLGLTKIGWEPDAIKDKIKSLKLNAELESEATRFHKPLVKQEEAALAKDQERKRVANEQKILADTQYTKSITDILTSKLKTKDFDGIPITVESAKQTKDFLDNKKWKLPSGELITDFDYAILELNKPQNHALKVKLGLLLSPAFKPGQPIDLNLGSVKKTAVSAENKEIFNFNKSKKTKYSASLATEDANSLKGMFD